MTNKAEQYLNKYQKRYKNIHTYTNKYTYVYVYIYLYIYIYIYIYLPLQWEIPITGYNICTHIYIYIYIYVYIYIHIPTSAVGNPNSRILGMPQLRLKSCWLSSGRLYADVCKQPVCDVLHTYKFEDMLKHVYIYICIYMCIHIHMSTATVKELLAIR
jgi:hypothetical protein